MIEATEEGPGKWTQAERDNLAFATFIQLSRIYDVLLFQSKDLPGIEGLIEGHQNGQLFGPEPVSGGPE